MESPCPLTVFKKTVLHRGRLKDAIAEYRTAIEFNPESALAHYNLGLCLSRQRELDDAIGQFQNAIVLEPDFAQAYLSLGKTLTKKKEILAAVKAIRQAIELAPGVCESPGRNSHGPVGM